MYIYLILEHRCFVDRSTWAISGPPAPRPRKSSTRNMTILTYPDLSFVEVHDRYIMISWYICIVYIYVYTLTLERPLDFGVIQKNGILGKEDLFFCRGLFLMFTSSHGGSLQHPTLDERFKPFLVQKDSKGGSCRKKDSMESCKTRFAPLLCSRDFFAVHVSACGACNAFSALSHVHCRRWVGIWNDPRKFGSNVVDDTK